MNDCIKAVKELSDFSYFEVGTFLAMLQISIGFYLVILIRG